MKYTYYIFDIPFQNLVIFRGAFIDAIQTVIEQYEKEELMIPMRFSKLDWDSQIQFLQQQFIHFHNHNDESAKTKHRIGYPLIQYRIEERGNKKYPAIMAFGECDRVIEILLMLRANLHYKYGNVNCPIQLLEPINCIEEIQLTYSNERQYYFLKNYMPLNRTDTKVDGNNQPILDNIQRYDALTNEADKNQFLKHLLDNHIISLANFLDIPLTEDIDVTIEQVVRRTELKTKTGYNYLMDLIISTHIVIPDLLAIGNNKTKDCGIIQSIEIDE